MRKIMSIGVSAMLILLAIGMWAAARTGHQNQSETAQVSPTQQAKIVTFDLMMHSKDLPARQYDAY
jgi:hypothetical protein